MEFMCAGRFQARTQIHVSGGWKSDPAQPPASVIAMEELLARIARSNRSDFPYDAVVDEFHRVGKHFVPKEVLSALDAVRGRTAGPAYAGDPLLPRFLDCALDKWDGKYDYSSYIALSLLPLPDGDDPSTAPARWNRLMVLLVTDALRREHEAADGRTEMLPQQRPDRFLFAKRCRLGMRVIRSGLGEIAPTDEEIAADPVSVSRQVCEVVDADTSDEERRFLRLSVLPVYVAHDEYLFIRVLQSFETTFALIAALSRAAIADLSRDRAAATIDDLALATSSLRRSAPLFSLLATMQVSSFRTFRQFTEGASAIQSANYKMVEALCRRQDPERLDSAAYHSVPGVRRQVMSGMTTLDETFAKARDAGRLTPAARGEVASAMDQFALMLRLWRQTHYRLALRMLGEARGTGYTEGTPYLRQVREIPVFLSTTRPDPEL